MKTAFATLAALLVALATHITAQPCQAQQGQYRIQGIWDAHYMLGGMPAYERLVLTHTGTFTKRCMWNGNMAFHTGQYLVGPSFLRLVHDRGPIRSETWEIRFLGPDRVLCRDHVMGTAWTMQRVGP